MRGEPDAGGKVVGTVLVVLAGAQARIEQFAGDVGEIDLAGILVLELLQAAAGAAVPQARPLGAGHLPQRLGFPAASLLPPGRVARYGPDIRWCPDRLALAASGRSPAGAEPEA